MKRAMLAAGLAASMTSAANAQYCEDVDVVHDGVLNVFDLTGMFLRWMEQNLDADFNDDGVVSGLDFGYQLVHFYGDGEGCLPLPVNTEVGYIEVEDVTDIVEPGPGFRAYDVFLTMYEPTTILLNVYDANVECVQNDCFDGAASYVTIGADPHFNPDLNFDMDAFASGNSLGEDAGWWASPFDGVLYGLAGNDPKNRVQIARFVMEDRTFLTGKLSFLVQRPDDPEPLAWQCLSVEVPVNDCFADFNLDGALDILDYVAYQNAFVAGDYEADCDGCGSLNILDFVCFHNQFHEGCD